MSSLKQAMAQVQACSMQAGQPMRVPCLAGDGSLQRRGAVQAATMACIRHVGERHAAGKLGCTTVFVADQPSDSSLFCEGSRCPRVRCSGEEVPAGRHRRLCAVAGGGPSRRAHCVSHEARPQGAAQQPPQKRGPAGTQPVSLRLYVTRTQAGPALCLWRCCLLHVLVPATAGSAACWSFMRRHLPLSTA